MSTLFVWLIIILGVVFLKEKFAVLLLILAGIGYLIEKANKSISDDIQRDKEIVNNKSNKIDSFDWVSYARKCNAELEKEDKRERYR